MVSIIGRDGNKRKQGDYSSWKSSSSSSGRSSSNSRPSSHSSSSRSSSFSSKSSRNSKPKLQIIGRDGNKREQGDYSSWNKKTSSSAGKSSFYSPGVVPSPVNPKYAQQFLQKNNKASTFNQPSKDKTTPKNNLKYRNANFNTGSLYGMPTRPTTSKNFVIEEHTPKSVKSGFNMVWKGEPLNPASGKDMLAPESHITHGFMKKTESWGTSVSNRLIPMIDKVPEPESLDIFGVSTVSGAKEVSKGLVDAGAGFIGMAGQVPYGIETMARDPSHAFEKVGVGLGAMGGMAVKGATENPLRFAGQMVGFSLGAKGVKMAGKPVVKASGKVLPKVTKARVVTTDGGSHPVFDTIDYGHSLSMGGKPLFTHVKGKGFQKGAAPAPQSLIQGKTVTAFSPEETAFFKSTLKNSAAPDDFAMFEAGETIAQKTYKYKKPIQKPSEFQVLSEHIPDAAKPAVKEAITTYKGKVDVYGSVSQKLQMGEHMTRTPGDIEVIVDNPSKFVTNLEPLLQKSGVNYEIAGESFAPKVHFESPTGGKMKGIEIFSKDAPTSLDLGGSYNPSYGIAYGFDPLKPVKVEGVKMMRLSEQSPRKLAGGHVLKDEGLSPVHEGRIKDIRDLAEIGAGYATEKGLPIGPEVLRYTEIASKKYPQITESPIIDFINTNKRLPSKTEISKLSERLSSRSRSLDSSPFEKELMFSKGPSASPLIHLKDLAGIDSKSMVASSFLRQSQIPSVPAIPYPSIDVCMPSSRVKTVKTHSKGSDFSSISSAVSSLILPSPSLKPSHSAASSSSRKPSVNSSKKQSKERASLSSLVSDTPSLFDSSVLPSELFSPPPSSFSSHSSKSSFSSHSSKSSPPPPQKIPKGGKTSTRKKRTGQKKKVDFSLFENPMRSVSDIAASFADMGTSQRIGMKTASEMMKTSTTKPASASSRSQKPKPKPKRTTANTRKTKPKRTTTKRRAKK